MTDPEWAAAMSAAQLFALMSAHMGAGFTREEAFELTRVYHGAALEFSSSKLLLNGDD